MHTRAPELLRPGSECGVTDAVSADRELADAAAELGEGDGHVHMLVRVDADDDPPLRRRKSNAFH
jgi:hypothetical protein